MIKKHNANEARLRRHRRVRKKVAGAPGRPRLSVFRSSDHIYAQIIDDERGHTLTAASSRDPELTAVAQAVQKAPLAEPPEAIKGIAANARVTQARAVGQLIARRAKALGIKRVVFDRGGYLYHGRIAALAHGAREGGLDF